MSVFPSEKVSSYPAESYLKHERLSVAAAAAAALLLPFDAPPPHQQQDVMTPNEPMGTPERHVRGHTYFQIYDRSASSLN